MTTDTKTTIDHNRTVTVEYSGWNHYSVIVRTMSIIDTKDMEQLTRYIVIKQGLDYH